MSTTSQAKISYLHSLQEYVEKHYRQRDAGPADRSMVYQALDLRSAIAKKLYFRSVDDPAYLAEYQAHQVHGDHGKPAIAQIRKWRLRNLWVRLFRRPLRPKVHSDLLCVVTHDKHKAFVEGLNIAVGQIIDLNDLHQFQRSCWIKTEEVSPFLGHLHPDLVLWVCALDELLELHQPRAIILVEGNTVVDQIVSLLAKKRSIPTTCIQYGWAMIPHIGFRDMNHDRFLSWGSSFSGVLNGFNPATQFIEVGHPSISTQQNVRSQLTVCAIFQAPARWMGHDTFDAFVELCVMLGQRGIAMDVRPHPAWPLSEDVATTLSSLSNVRIRQGSEVPLQTQLEEAAVVLTVFSSVGFEAMLQDCIPVFYQPFMELEMHPTLNELGFQTLFHDQSSVMAFMESLQQTEVLKQHQEKVQHAKSSFFHPFDHATFEAVVIQQPGQ